MGALRELAKEMRDYMSDEDMAPIRLRHANGLWFINTIGIIVSSNKYVKAVCLLGQIGSAYLVQKETAKCLGTLMERK